jgi:ADP-heptose:LPS heptosyltransferase
MDIRDITQISRHHNNTVNLQYDVRDYEKNHLDFIPPMTSWLNTASIVQHLDLVVTVDTAIAHMAGTLGVPCMMMSAIPGDWRWGTSGELTPWYKSMRIFRQRKIGEWGPVIQDVNEAIESREWVAWRVK